MQKERTAACHQRKTSLHAGDVAEMWGRCGGKVGERWGRGGERWRGCAPHKKGGRKVRRYQPEHERVKGEAILVDHAVDGGVHRAVGPAQREAGRQHRQQRRRHHRHQLQAERRDGRHEEEHAQHLEEVRERRGAQEGSRAGGRMGRTSAAAAARAPRAGLAAAASCPQTRSPPASQPACRCFGSCWCRS